MKEQIEEMAKIAHESCKKYGGSTCHYADCYFKYKPILCSECVIVRELYNAGYRKQEWISVEDRLPSENGFYILYMKNGNMGGVPICVENDLEWLKAVVSHWMPLPEPPKMKGGAE